MSYTEDGEWPVNLITCGRLKGEPSKAMVDRLERAARRGEKINRGRVLTLLGRECSMEFQSHRPFWSGEWMADFTLIGFVLPSAYTPNLLAQRLDLLAPFPKVHRRVSLDWSPPPARIKNAI
jgi:hypothetical protein